MKIVFIKLMFDKIFWKTVKELIYIWYIKKFVKYYIHIDYLPLFNFAEIMKGKFEYLFVGKKRRPPKIFFANIFAEMNFQFKELDNTHLRNKADLADYYSKYIRTANKRWLNEYNTLKKKIDNVEHTTFNLDEFTDYIEQTFNFAPGSIDVKKISTAKAFNNYQKAIKHRKAIKLNQIQNKR